jgi:four helix bundle protein
LRRFVSIARGSGGELQTQLAVAVALELIGADELTALSSQLDRLSKMLFGLYRSLARQEAGRPSPVVRRPSPVARRP